MRRFLSSPATTPWAVLFAAAGVGALLWGACSQSDSGNPFNGGPGTSSGSNTSTSSGAGGAAGSGLTTTNTTTSSTTSSTGAAGAATSTTASGGAAGTSGAGGAAGTGGAGTGGAGAGGTGTGGTAGKGGAGGAAGAAGSGGKAGAGGAGGGGAGGAAGAGGSGGGMPGDGKANVLQHHKNASRDGLYVDAAFTKAAAGRIHRDTTFAATAIQGPTYAQPLYFENAAGGKNLVIVATERNVVYAIDAANGSIAWQRTLAAPVALNQMPCGNIDPFGVSGTPIIDAASKTLFVAALATPDGGNTKRHQIFALSLDDGTPRAGWPVDVSNISANGATFQAQVHSQRAALALLNGTLYVPYGGMYGDCGSYHGWVVGVPIGAANPQPTAYATAAVKSGIWGPGGIASDGTSLFVTTGNAPGGTAFGHQESLLRIAPGPAFTNQAANYFTPSNWQQLDTGDVDLGGSGPLVIDVAGATPSRLLVALGKNGIAYLVDRTNLGGIVQNGAMFQGIHHLQVTSSQIIQAAAAYTTNTSTYVSMRGSGTGCATGNGDLTTIKISAASPPRLSSAWCASGGGGSPMVTTTDGRAEAVVWQIATGGTARLRGFDGDTGAVVFNGGVTADQMGSVQGFQTAIAARGRIFVAGNSAVYAFTTQ